MALEKKTFKFDVKAAAEAGKFSGRASVYGVVDSYNDVVMPGSFANHLASVGSRIVVLNQHDTTDPIGTAQLSDSDTALLADGSLVLELPSAKNAYTRLLNELIDGISIGYEVVKDSFVNSVRQLHEIRLWEISLVTFPANAFARVTDVKSHLMQLLERKDADPTIARLLKELNTADFAEACLAYKVGAVLSNANRKRIVSAYELLKEIVDETDPDKDNKHVLETFTNTLRSLTATAR